MGPGKAREKPETHIPKRRRPVGKGGLHTVRSQPYADLDRAELWGQQKDEDFPGMKGGETLGGARRRGESSV